MGGRLILIGIVIGASVISSWLALGAQAAPKLGPELQPDAFIAPDLALDMPGLMATMSITPGYYQTSEYMAGSVAVSIILVESHGDVDPSTEDWTPEEKQLVLTKVAAALEWWATLEPRARLRFVIEDHATHPLTTSVEPINRPYTDQSIWIAEAMSALGYTAPSYVARVRDYNNWLRAAYHTDWAFAIFVVDSSNDGDGSFRDGYFAYAYLGGPFMVMTLDNGDYGPTHMDAVAAHEIGHIFHALDQYTSASQSCATRSGYLGVENQNSEYGGCASNVSSIMRGHLSPYVNRAIDPYAAGQLGWRDSDGDGVFDPLDTAVPITITAMAQQDNRVAVTGTAEIAPWASPTRPSVTINTLTGVQYRVDQGDWQPAVARDGAFDSLSESYYLSSALEPGRHVLQIAAQDSAGNVSAVHATQVITVFDPVDGGLTTWLDAPGDQRAGSTIVMRGRAVELQGGVVASVQYRVDGGVWQLALAQDGEFDSGDEAFTFTVGPLAAGLYRIQARAMDAGGKFEVNLADRFVAVKQHAVFLPFVVR